MTDTKAEIIRRLSVLIGLDVSGVSHAADMLTLHFGPQKHFRSRRGTVLEGGAWALHVQCPWQLKQEESIVATQFMLSQPDDDAHQAADWLNAQLVTNGPTIVSSISASGSGAVQLAMSNHFCLDIISGCVPDEEDWRFFEPGTDTKHFVIEGGKIDPWCLS
ncbi:conserved hypothetical protein [Burkholderia sp. 8Y]|uniref:hypothetical protein n=1 Tax=Burkholderia sp. 8Y TaxID=2653133 RepID=UPI0012EEF225|nr:hypothetical protein [Burkholderia sp. 8Y]VXB84820.1 conserved hypothetical protein [Burkholderia sp. 8Y]